MGGKSGLNLALTRKGMIVRVLLNERLKYLGSGEPLWENGK